MSCCSACLLACTSTSTYQFLLGITLENCLIYSFLWTWWTVVWWIILTWWYESTCVSLPRCQHCRIQNWPGHLVSVDLPVDQPFLPCFLGVDIGTLPWVLLLGVWNAFSLNVIGTDPIEAISHVIQFKCMKPRRRAMKTCIRQFMGGCHPVVPPW